MPIRPAHPDDAAAISAILDHEIRTGVAHFGDTTPSIDVLRDEIETHPTFVATRGDEVVGFASLRPWKERAAYRWAAEIGIYLAPGAQGRGLGGRLVDCLLERAQADGLRTLVAGMTLPNPASRGLFESRGFVRAGVFPEIGFKQGRWHDVGYWSLRLPER